MAVSRFLVADRNNNIIAELEPDIGPVSWRLNKVGKVQFALSLSDPKLTEDNLRYGNRVLIEFDNGLPAWGGTIDPPRDWQMGSAISTAYSGEHIFGQRTTDKGRYFAGATVGYIYEKLIEDANGVHDMNITAGEIWPSGNTHSPDYHYKDLLTIFQESLTKRLSNIDFNITAKELGGKILFKANLYQRLGISRPGVALVEDVNLTEIRLIEQGPIVNSWDMAGEGDDWGDDRLTSHAEDTTSIATYGLRQGSRIYADVSLQETLDVHAANALAESKDLYNMLELTAADLAPGMFADYGLGDSVRVLLHSYGFGGYEKMVRVMAREYDPGTGFCKLVVREE